MADLTLAPQPASIRLLTPGFRSSEWNFAKEVILDQIFVRELCHSRARGSPLSFKSRTELTRFFFRTNRLVG
jgi:hypothetical protein